MMKSAILLALFATVPGMGGVAPLHTQTKATKNVTPQAVSPAKNSPSLDETLKWLANFLPTATGAVVPYPGTNGSVFGQKEVTSFSVVNDCEVDITNNLR